MVGTLMTYYIYQVRQIRAAYYKGERENKVAAIKEAMYIWNLTLKEAKEAVEHFIARKWNLAEIYVSNFLPFAAETESMQLKRLVDLNRELMYLQVHYDNTDWESNGNALGYSD